jgi:uncharacterized damage-inducible protein DinB
MIRRAIMFGWKKHCLYQIDYQYWANQQLFDALSRLTDAALAADGHVLPLLAQMHAEVLRWGEHLGAPAAEAVPHGDLRSLAQALRHQVRALQHWLESCPETFFERQLEYTDNHHRRHSDWARDMLTQLLTGMTHLRGQIVVFASLLGAPMPAVDFIDYKREVKNTLDHLAGA